MPSFSRYLLIFAGMFIMFIHLSCRNENEKFKGNDSYDPELENIRFEAMEAAIKKDYNKSDSLGKILFQEAEKKDNERYKAYGLLCESYYNFNSSTLQERFNRIKQAEKIALSIGNDTLLSRIYSTLGGYATLGFYNLTDAKIYYSEAIRYSKQANAPDFVLANECNLSELYHALNDTLSIDFDLDIYNKSLDSDNIGLLVAAAQHCAEYFLMKTETAPKAIPFIEKLNELGETYKYHHLLGKYYLVTGETEKARQQLDKAISYDVGAPGVYMTYGSLLNREKDYLSSIKLLERALRLFGENDSYNPSQIEVFKIQADNYRHTGHYEKALINFDIYTQLKDSVNKIRIADELQKYKVRYETERKEAELVALRSKNRQKDFIIIGTGVMLALIILFFIFYTSRRTRLHRIIALQNRDFFEREKEMKPAETASPQIPTDKEEVTTAVGTENSTSLPGMSHQKMTAIWNRVESLMEKDEIWRRRELTRDNFAEEAGCNHTWLSAVIKEKTGMTYLQFINARRVREAVELLSRNDFRQTQKEVAFRVGFASLSTYYSAFKAKMDMSPAEFRRHIEHGFVS